MFNLYAIFFYTFHPDRMYLHRLSVRLMPLGMMGGQFRGPPQTDRYHGTVKLEGYTVFSCWATVFFYCA